MNDLSQYALIGGLIALWTQVRSIFDRIRALLVTRIVLDGEVAKAVKAYLYETGKVLDWGDRYIYSTSSFVRPLDRVIEVAVEGPPKQGRFVWLGWNPVMFSANSSESGVPENYAQIRITYLRWSIDIVSLTKTALIRSSQQLTTGQRYRVRRIVGHSKRDYSSNMGSVPPPGIAQNVSYERGSVGPNDRLLHWRFSDLGAQIPEAPFEAMVLDDDSETARTEFDRWLEMRDWYKTRSIPWRRGFLFAGPPGTGKTSLARALAQSADIPVYVYDLATLSNEEFSREWQEMQECTPCMALLEDIDACFHGRVNVHDDPDALTFDCLLNAIGGIQSADGVFLIVTTNRPETLDGALTRPGRIDRTFNLGLPTEDGRSKILERITGNSDDVDETANMTVAEVTEYAVSKALECVWSPASS